MAKAAKGKAPPTQESIDVRIVVDTSIDTPAYYVNHAEISVGEHDLTMTFVRLPAKPSRADIEEAKDSGELVIESEFQVIFPPTLLPGLIRALESTYQEYEARHGEIRKPKDD